MVPRMMTVVCVVEMVPVALIHVHNLPIAWIVWKFQYVAGVCLEMDKDLVFISVRDVVPRLVFPTQHALHLRLLAVLQQVLVLLHREVEQHKE